MYKNALHPRAKYYNSILPSMYREAYPVMQTKFEAYFFQDRSWCYELKTWTEKIALQIKSKLDVKNLASYGKFTLNTFRSTQPSHVQQCAEGVKQICELFGNIKEKSEELKSLRTDMYVGMTLKSGMKRKG